MIGTFLWFTALGARNRTLRRLRRVREPRYALAVLVGLAYLWLIFLRPGRPAPLTSAITGDIAHLIYALGIALLVASWWLLGGEKAALHFSSAEVQLLFPAPLSRRQLVLLKLMQAQSAIVLSTIIWVLLFGGTAGSIWLRAISVWVLLSTLYLHRVGASLVRASAAEHGTTGVRHNAWAIALFGAAVIATIWSTIHALPSLRSAAAQGDLPAAVTNVLRGPAMSVVLYPFRLVLAPLFASTLSDWERAIGPAFLIMAVHYPWVLRTDVAFEEAAAEAAVRRAAMLAATRSHSRVVRRPGRGAITRLPLAPAGPPAGAILWKNSLALGRTISVPTIIAFIATAAVALAVTLSAAPSAWSGANAAGIACLAFAGFLTIVGPLWIRNDLRLDLLRLDLLRSYPLRGASIVRAEVMSSAAMLTALQLVLILAAYIILPRRTDVGYTLSDRTALLATAVLALPAVNVVGLTIQNGAALLFPSWVRLGLARPGGVEAIGQGLVTTLGSLFGLVTLLLPPTAIGGALALFGLAKIGLWGIVPGAALTSVSTFAELWGITAWLGGVFDRTEPLENVESAM